MKTPKLRLWSEIALLSTLFMVWVAAPKLASQAPSLLFGSYMNSAKAVQVDSGGKLRVSCDDCGGSGGMGTPAGSTNAVQYNAGSGNFGGVTLNTTATAKYLKQVSSGVSAFVQIAVSDLSGFGSGVATFLATPTSANLAAALTDETGTAKAVFSTSPLFTTPTIAGAGAGIAILQYANSATSRTLTIPDPGAADTFAMLGATQTLVGKTLTTPTIASFVNATHDHSTSAGGGQIAENAFSFTNVTTANATSSQHGLMPKGSGSATDCYLGDLTVAACPGGSSYTNLFQNGSNGLFVRNSTTAQTFDLAGTYTSSTDFKSLQLTYGTDVDSNVGVMLRNNKGSSTSTYPNLLFRAQGPADFILTEEHGGYEKSIQMLQSASNISICPRDTNCLVIDQSGGKVSLSSPGGTLELNPNGTVDASVVMARAGSVFTCVGCGTSPTLLGNNLAGRVTIGTAPSAAIVLTMPIPWTANNAACWAVDETTGVVAPAVASGTATLTITGTFLVTQTVAFGCLAIQ